MNETGIVQVRPTIYFMRRDGSLRQKVDVTLRVNEGWPCVVRFECPGVREEIALASVPEGESFHEVLVPDLREPARVTFTLERDGKPVGTPVEINWKPTRHWNVYYIQYAHFDPGYTDLAVNIQRQYDRDFEDMVKFCEETNAFPEDSKFRYVIEQSWPLVDYLRRRTPGETAKLISFLREGRLELNAFYANQISEHLAPEEMARVVYGSFDLARRHGVPIRTAEHNDVPGISWSYVTLLANSGVRYFAPGLPDYFRWGDGDYHNFWDEETIQPGFVPRPFYWEGPTGDRVLFFAHDRGASGLVEYNLEEVPQYLEGLAERGYPYESVRYLLRGGKSDNASPAVDFSYTMRDWNKKWAYPRYINATNIMFWKALEAELEDDIPVFRGELPGTDYPIGALCTARETGITRLCHDRLPNAEKFATVAAAVSDYPYQKETIDDSYENMLRYDEHCFGMARPVGPAQEAAYVDHNVFAYRALALAHDVEVKALNRIVDQIEREDDAQYIVVFNPLSWTRDDIVRAPLRPADPCARPLTFETYEIDGRVRSRLHARTAIGRDIDVLGSEYGEKPIRVTDMSTGDTVPHQIVTIRSAMDPVPYASQRTAMKDIRSPNYAWELHFLAGGLPPLGYKVFRIDIVEEAPEFSSDMKIGDHTLENRFFKVTLDPETGAIASVIDKETGLELVDQASRHQLNQIVTRVVKTGEEELPGPARTAPGREGPLSISLLVSGDAPGCPEFTQEVILYNDIKRVDLATRILKNVDSTREIYLAFPFLLKNPRFHYETPYAVVEYLVDQMPGSNSDYASVQHWADVSDGTRGIVWASLEAPQAEFGNLWPGYVSQAHHGVKPKGFEHDFVTDPDEIENGHIYSYLLTNNFRTNFHPVQVGDMLFRYSFRPHAGDWKEGDVRKFGWEFACPLIPIFIGGNNEGSLPLVASFIDIDAPNVMLLTAKQAEDGRGTVLRLLETHGESAKARVRLPWLAISKAELATIPEEPLSELPFTDNSFEVEVRPWDVVTVKLQENAKTLSPVESE